MYPNVAKSICDLTSHYIFSYSKYALRIDITQCVRALLRLLEVTGYEIARRQIASLGPPYGENPITILLALTH